MYKCAREGCKKPARGDEYCSTTCCRIAHGLEDPPKKTSSPPPKKVDLQQSP